MVFILVKSMHVEIAALSVARSEFGEFGRVRKTSGCQVRIHSFPHCSVVQFGYVGKMNIILEWVIN